ncbi:M23 family metallopeptidase [Bacillus sp. HMF5848]|uniref:M23 family metallopeptidase n=1 Tax=Bacillus sp. HMF5848 TaxID=2495421 RepID=UPI000F7A51C4|nr:M23 family metallopeptidase [Bacillus sp. HMF5848]RSK27187.1 M23 family metallopeptidase [Bacillus sp. HMF5848]
MLFNFHYAFIPDFLTALIIPILLLIWLWKSKLNTKIDWILNNLLVGSYIIMIYFVANWWFFSYYFRYLFVLCFLMLAILSWKKVNNLSWFPPYSLTTITGNVIKVLFIGVFAVSSNSFTLAYDYNEEAIDLQFPLKDGVYSIFQGGNGEKSTLMNYHYRFPLFQQSNVHDSMQYAIDIEKLNLLGTSRYGVFIDNPSKFNLYEIYGEVVYSPVDGIVTNVQDKFADVSPGASFGKGNTLTIKTDHNIYISLLHLKAKSTSVKIGDKIQAGQPIAAVGTSGTGLPHLHIHAAKNAPWGKGVPIRFDGKFVVKNNLIFK